MIRAAHPSSASRLDIGIECGVIGDVSGRVVVADNIPIGVTVARAGRHRAAHGGRAYPDQLREVPDGLKVAPVIRPRVGAESVTADLVVPKSDKSVQEKEKRLGMEACEMGPRDALLN